MKKKVSIILPYKEIYSENFAGAASIWLKDYMELSTLAKETVIYGNLDKKFKPITKNFKNIRINNTAFSKTKAYINFFYKDYLKEKYEIIEIHNRPEYLNFLIKKNVHAKLIFFFHNNPQDIRGSKTINERLNILKQTDKVFFVSNWTKKKFFEGLPFKTKSNCEILYPSIKKVKKFNKNKKTKIQLLGSGAILREIIAAAEILEKDYKIDSDVWSVTSYNELRKEAMEVERYNLLNPDKTNKKSHIEKCLSSTEGPIVSASDYIRLNSDQIRPFTGKSFYSLGTDGYGRSDTRKNLRKFFEVDKEHLVAYSLSILAKEQLIASKYANEAIKKYKIDGEKPMPTKL